MKRAVKTPAPNAGQIRAARESAELSQSAAADLLGVSLRTWQNWESGTHKMRPAFWDVFQERLSKQSNGSIRQDPKVTTV